MISVVMASYLGEYLKAASDREKKLQRAIDSFLRQDVGELIVVSDGCQKTIEIVNHYSLPSIKLLKLDKQPLFSGTVRQAGIAAATYDWICYLDSDDEFADGHLRAIINSLSDDVDWVYYDDIVKGVYRNVLVEHCKIGTSNIAHRKNLMAEWPSGYEHDWRFIQQLGNKYKKISGAGYIVHHIPGEFDN